MTLAGPRAQLPQQGGVINCQHLARQGLDIEREVGLVGGHRIEDRQQLLRLGEGGRLCGLVRIAEARAIAHHPVRFPPGKIGKPDRGGRGPEDEEPVAPDLSKAREYLRQLLAAHALDGNIARRSRPDQPRSHGLPPIEMYQTIPGGRRSCQSLACW